MKLKHLHSFVFLGCHTIVASPVQARDYRFNPALLAEGELADISVLSRVGGALPGEYQVDVYINNNLIESRNIDFYFPDKQQPTLIPCFTVETLINYGILVRRYPDMTEKSFTYSGKKCLDINAIPYATTNFNLAELKLMLSIPQSALSRQDSSFISPDMWDDGIPALLMNYSFNGTTLMSINNEHVNSYNANLQPGANYGPWRLRNFSNWTNNGGMQNKWQTAYTYAQRTFNEAALRLTLGEYFTGADVFDPVSFLGAQISSDEYMQPYDRQGYAPTVSGIARTNARIEVRQGNSLIHTSNVAPGPFVLDSIAPISSGGNLDVYIHESDGQVQRLMVPYSSVPMLLRSGKINYSITAGNYRPNGIGHSNQGFTQLTGAWGLPGGMTIYGGSQLANNYQAFNLGAGAQLGWVGALSGDITQAYSHYYQSPSEQGQSMRARYSKSLTASGTNTLAGYRYNTRGYSSMEDVLGSYSTRSSTDERLRARFEIQLSQPLEQWGNLSLTWVRDNYWNMEGTRESLGLSYGIPWLHSFWSISGSYNRFPMTSGENINESQFALNVSVPLNGWLDSNMANYSLSSGKNQRQHNLNLSGTGMNQLLSWSMQHSLDETNINSNSYASAYYRGGSGELNMGYGYNSDYGQIVNYGGSGGVLLHENGITLSQTLGQTLALVTAPGAAGAKVNDANSSISIDNFGYAVLPHLQPYTENSLSLIPTTLPDDAELESTTVRLIPSDGAIMRAQFAVQRGKKLLVTLLRQSGKPVPFGAQVALISSDVAKTAFVGDESKVYLSGMPDQGTLQVRWGHGQDKQCALNYSLSDISAQNGLYQISSKCL